MWRTGLVICCAIALLAGTTASAGPGPWNDKTVYVTYESGLYCTLDATGIKRYTGLGGTTIVDAQVNYRLDVSALKLAMQMPEDFPEGMVLKNLKNISVRYLFRLESADSEQVPLYTELEKRFTDANGELLGETEFREPWAGTVWRRMGQFEQAVLHRLLTEPNFYGKQSIDPRMAKYIDLSGMDDGILGRPWGMQPGAFPGATPIGKIDDRISVYHLVASAWPILGDVRAHAGIRLLFDKQTGLFGARIPLKHDEADKVATAFNQKFGETVLSRQMGDRMQNGPDAIWSVGRNTRASLVSPIGQAFIEIARANRPALPPFKPDEITEATEKANRSITTKYAWQTLWGKAADGGVLGIPWGTPVDAVDPMLLTGSVNIKDWRVIFTDVGIPAADTNNRTPARLYFLPGKGLVLAIWEFSAELRPTVETQLRFAWGEATGGKAGVLSWRLGGKSAAVLDFERNGDVGVLMIAEEGFWTIHAKQGTAFIR